MDRATAYSPQHNKEDEIPAQKRYLQENLKLGMTRSRSHYWGATGAKGIIWGRNTLKGRFSPYYRTLQRL